MLLPIRLSLEEWSCGAASFDVGGVSCGDITFAVRLGAEILGGTGIPFVVFLLMSSSLSLLEVIADVLAFESLQPSSELSGLVYHLGCLKIHKIVVDND